MMNNPHVRSWARAFGKRIAEEKTPEGAVHRAYRLALSRDASPDELADGLAFVKAQEASYAGKADARELALADFCQVVMCLNEFVYVE